MSLSDGLAAVHLEMPERVPRFEPGVAKYHVDLVSAVTGLPITPDSTEEDKLRAQQAFFSAWDYGIFSRCLIGKDELTALSTDMGHAEYAVDGSDFNDNLQCPFSNPEEVFAQVSGVLDRLRI